MDTIPSLFARQAARFKNKTLFLFKRDGRYQAMSWNLAQEQVSALSAFLLSRNVNSGDRVIILSENRPEWGIADLAIQSIGAWTVPLYPSLTSADIYVIAKDTKPILYFSST